MARLFLLILVGFGMVSSCSKPEPKGSFGPGPGGAEMEEGRCKE